MCSICVYSVLVLSCVQVAALRRADHTSKESYQLCIDQEIKKRPGPTRAVEPIGGGEYDLVIDIRAFSFSLVFFFLSFGCCYSQVVEELHI
jgi:hypothetical protein